MTINKDLENNSITFLDKENKLAEFKLINEQYIMTFYTKEKIKIDIEDDISILEQFITIMINSYENTNTLYQDEDKIECLSDGNIDISNKEELKKVSRLVIEKDSKNLYLSAYTPYLEENNIDKPQVVLFDPINGHYSNNYFSGNTFQNEIINAHKTILDMAKAKINIKIKDNY